MHNVSEHRPYLSERQLVVFVYRFFRKTGMILPKWLFWGKLCCIFSIVFVGCFCIIIFSIHCLFQFQGAVRRWSEQVALRRQTSGSWRRFHYLHHEISPHDSIAGKDWILMDDLRWTLHHWCWRLCSVPWSHLSNEKNLDWLGYTRDYTTQLYRDYNKPL